MKGALPQNLCKTQTCIICACNENILDLSIFQIIQHGSPEFRAFILADPHSKYRFPAFEIDAYRYVNSFFHYLTFTANVVMYTTAYTLSSGLCCHSRASGTILSVIRLTVVSEMFMP